MSTRRAALTFAVAAIATLIAGYVLEQSGDAASSEIGLSGILFGATVLTLATSLPEISTGLQSIRQGDDNLAISDILGGNAFLPVLFLLAALISGKAVLPQAQSADIYLTAVAMLLTAVYAFGLHLALLETMSATTKRPELQALFDDHAAETRHQISRAVNPDSLLTRCSPGRSRFSWRIRLRVAYHDFSVVGKLHGGPSSSERGHFLASQFRRVSSTTCRKRQYESCSPSTRLTIVKACCSSRSCLGATERGQP